MNFREDNYPILKTIEESRKQGISLFEDNISYDNAEEGSKSITSILINQALNYGSVYYITKPILNLFIDGRFNMLSLKKEILYHSEFNEYGFIITEGDFGKIAYFINSKADNYIIDLNTIILYHDNSIFSITTSQMNLESGDIDGEYLSAGLPESIYNDFDLENIINGSQGLSLIFSVFKRFVETEMVIVNRNKRKVKVIGEKYKNDLDLDITIIDSYWYREILRVEGFGVKGHFRMQPCGVGRGDYKFIYIKPFKKFGYHRKAKIQNQENG